MSNDKGSGMKSAYEAALEKLEQAGIERPRDDALSDAARAEIAELRRRADAKLAELDVLHRDRLRKVADPSEREKEEDDYRRQRRRIEEERDRKIAKVREGDG